MIRCYFIYQIPSENATVKGILLLIKLKIKNWQKFNPKRAQKTYTWARIDCRINRDDRLYDLTAEQKLVWIEIILCAAPKNTGFVALNIAEMAAVLKISEILINSTIKFLITNQLVEYATTGPLPRHYTETTPTNERTNVRTNTCQPHEAVDPIAEVWNKNCGTLPKVASLNDARRKKFLSLAKKRTEEQISSAVRRVANSRFCCGENKTSWRATFDWFIRSGTIEKIEEGNYDGKKVASNGDI